MALIQQYLQYFNWNYLFIVFAVFGLIGGIVALIRGIRHTVAKYIVDGILIVLLLAYIKQLAILVGDINLSSLNYAFTVQGVSYPLTTVNLFVINVIEGSGLVSSASDPALVQLGLSLVQSIIGLAVMVVGILIIVILLGPILGDIFRLIFGAIFSSSEKREKKEKVKKHRFASFLVALVCGSVIGALLLSPLTAAANSISRTAIEINNAQDNGELSEDQFGEYQDLIDLFAAYQDSQVFAAMTLGTGNEADALDTKIMDQVTYMTISGTKIYISSEVTNLIEMLSTVASSVSYDGTDLNIDFTAASSPDTIQSLLDGLGNWQILMELLPIAVEIGLNGADTSSYDFDLDFSDIDWSDSLTDISTIYEKFYDAGLVEEYVLPMLKNEAVPDAFLLDYTQKDSMKALVEAVGDSELISTSLSEILSGFAKQTAIEQGIDYISTDITKYDAIDWGDELANTVEFAYDLGRLLDLTSINSETMDGLTETLTDALNDSGKLENVKSLICGGSISFEATADLPADLVEGFDGLLNSAITTSGIIDISGMLKSVLGSVDGINDYIDQTTLYKVCDDIGESNDLAGEVGIMIDAIPELKKIADDGLDLENDVDGSVDTIRSILDIVKDSEIISGILPGMIKSILSDSQFEDLFYGLTVDDFDFECLDTNGDSQLIPEVENLLDVISLTLNLTDTLSDESLDTNAKLDNIDTGDLKTILTALVSSQIINPERRIDGTDTVVKNTNFNNLLTSMLGDDSITSTGLAVPSDITDMDWLGDGTLDNPGEISRLCDVFDTLIQYKDFFLSESGMNLEDIDGAMISDIFGSLGRSELLSSSLSDILNQQIAPMLSGLGISIDFNDVTDWEAEGSALGTVVDRLNEIGTADIASIDWAGLDPDQINSILTALSETQMLSIQQDDDGFYVDMFGQLAYTLIEKAGMTDMVGDSLSADTFSSVENKYTGELKDDFNWTKNIVDSTYTLNGTDALGDPTTEEVAIRIDTEGEIYNICNIFDEVGKIDLDDLGGAGITGDQLSSLLKAIEKSDLFSASVPYFINYAIDQIPAISIGTDSIDLGLANPDYLLSATDSEIDEEIDKLATLYSAFTDGTMTDLVPSDPQNFTSDQIATLEDILSEIADSKIFNTVRSGDDYSLYTELFASVIHATTLDEMITGADAATAKEKLLPLIADIDNWTFDTTMDSAAREAYTGSAILNFTKVIRIIADEGISTVSLTNPGDIDEGAISDMLKAINSSEVLHPAISQFFDKIFTSMNMDSYLEIDGSQYRVINTNVYTDYSAESIDFWDGEIDALVTLFVNIKNISGAGLDFTNIEFGGAGISMYDFIGPIDDMRLLDDCKEYIIYNMLSSGGNTFITQYIREIDAASAQYGSSDAKAYTIKKLLMPLGHTQEYLVEQCSILDGFISTFTNIKDADFSDGAAFSSVVYQLMMNTFYLEYDSVADKTTYVRGYLAQELVSSMLSEKLGAVDPADAAFFNSFFYADSAYENDYYYFNIIEARGLEGVASLSSIGAYGDAGFNDALTSAFTLMGRAIDSTSEYDALVDVDADKKNALLNQTEDKLTLDLYKNQDSADRLLNSRLAIKLFNHYADDVAILGGKTIADCIVEWNALVDTPVAFVAAVHRAPTEDDKIDFQNGSFEENGDAFITALGYLAA